MHPSEEVRIAQRKKIFRLLRKKVNSTLKFLGDFRAHSDATQHRIKTKFLKEHPSIELPKTDETIDRDYIQNNLDSFALLKNIYYQDKLIGTILTRYYWFRRFARAYGFQDTEKQDEICKKLIMENKIEKIIPDIEYKTLSFFEDNIEAIEKFVDACSPYLPQCHCGAFMEDDCCADACGHCPDCSEFLNDHDIARKPLP